MSVCLLSLIKWEKWQNSDKNCKLVTLGILFEQGRSELNFSIMGKVAKTVNTKFCTYRRLEFTERHLESCSNEPSAMKQVMVPEVREHSIPIHEMNGPSFSFMTAKWLFCRRRAFNIIQITDSVTWKGHRSHYKIHPVQCLSNVSQRELWLKYFKIVLLYH